MVFANFYLTVTKRIVILDNMHSLMYNVIVSIDEKTDDMEDTCYSIQLLLKSRMTCHE